MYIAMNRFKVQTGSESDFENHLEEPRLQPRAR